MATEFKQLIAWIFRKFLDKRRKETLQIDIYYFLQ